MALHDSTLDEVRQKAIHEGLKSLSESELIALIALIEVPLATHLLEVFDGLEKLLSTTAEELMALDGIGISKALSLCAAFYLASEIALLPVWRNQRVVIRRPGDIARLVLPYFAGKLQEEFCVILLDSHNAVMDIETIYRGSLNATIVRVGEIFRPAITQNAAGLIVAHNHPTGDITPSPQDVDLTRTLVDAGQILDIPLVDHLVVADGRWLSLREKNLGF